MNVLIDELFAEVLEMISILSFQFLFKKEFLSKNDYLSFDDNIIENFLSLNFSFEFIYFGWGIVDRFIILFFFLSLNDKPIVLRVCIVILY